MPRKNFKKLVSTLSNEERLTLFNELKSLVIPQINSEMSVCPCCRETKFIKWGRKNDVQRYKCKTTNAIFTFKSNTVLSGIKLKDKFLKMLELFVDRSIPTITRVQEHLSISRQTAFDWRTKLLTALYQPKKWNDSVIEFDELNQRLSFKGRNNLAFGRKRGKKLVGDNKYNTKIFASYNRSTKEYDLFLSHMGRTSTDDVRNYFDHQKRNILYSDSHPSYISYYNHKNIIHGVFKSKDHVNKRDRYIHVQGVNEIAGDVQNLINYKSKGVSTKYMQGYLNWISFVKNAIKKGIEPVNRILENKVALDIFKQKEKEFQYFLRNSGRSCFGECRIPWKLAS